MDRNEAVTLIQLQGGMKLVKVAFLYARVMERRAPGSIPDSPKFYTYKCLTVQDPRINDIVAVETSDGPALAKVVEVLTNDPHHVIQYGRLQHVIGRIEMGHLDYIKNEEGRVKDQLAMAEISARLQQVQHYYGQPLAALSTPALLGRPAVVVETP